MLLKIDEIKPTKSLKNFDKKHRFLVKNMIKKYGQIYPIIINKNYEIIKGNTVFEILKELNFDEVFVKVIDCDNNIQLYLELSMNNGELNPIECFEQFKRIDVENNFLPYTKLQILDFIKLLEFDWSMYNAKRNNISDLF